jgi:hypothetical protein
LRNTFLSLGPDLLLTGPAFFFVARAPLGRYARFPDTGPSPQNYGATERARRAQTSITLSRCRPS